MIEFFKKKRFPAGAPSWGFYDWASNAFATTVIAGFFPIFFGSYWSQGVTHDVSTFWLGISISTASLAVALISPILGAFADRGGRRKKFLLFCCYMGAMLTSSLFWVQAGHWQIAAALYVVASIFYYSGESLYSSLIVDVSSEKNVDFISGFGFSMGYLGGGILFVFNVIMTLNPHWFGLIDEGLYILAQQASEGALSLEQIQQRVQELGLSAAALLPELIGLTQLEEAQSLLQTQIDKASSLAVRISFLSVGLWWGIFALPLAFNVKEKNRREQIPLRQAMHEGFASLMINIKKIVKQRDLFLFLLAYWFYIDGVHAVITMATKTGQGLGFPTADLITALVMVQFVAFPFALLTGWIGQKIGPRPVILTCICMYLVVIALVWAVPDPIDPLNPMKPDPWILFGLPINQFFLLAFLIGTVQGGVQSQSRSLFSRLIPKDQAGEYYGFYNMIGKSSTIIGTSLVGVVTLITGSGRYGMLSLLLLFALGVYFLLKVQLPKQKSY
jgi:MFS transporter, UMF1 family